MIVTVRMKPKQHRMPGYHCYAVDSEGRQCNHEWISRMKEKVPVQCPKCKSRKWQWEKGK